MAINKNLIFMKKCFLLFGLLLLAAVTFAQAPQAFKYQAVARNTIGEPLENQEISVLISILAGNPSGTVVYSERHLTTTNSLGLFDLEIGNPDEALSGIFSEINWGTGSFFLKVELDETGGSDYQFMGVSQLLSVPYALLSENTVNNDDADADPANELQTVTKEGQIVTLSQNGGNFTDDVNDADADPTNELQNLSSTKNGNLVDLGISNGTGTTINVSDADADPVNELQTLTQNGLEVSLSQNGGTINVADNDNDPSNELQQISKVGSTVTLSQGGGSFIDAVDDTDADPNNEIQTVTQIDYNVTLSKGGGSFLTGVRSYTQSEIDALAPFDGLTVYNSTTHCINFYTINNWFESCGDCIPQPSQANAGDDQCFTDSTISVFLAANTPLSGVGLWTILSGDGGTFQNTLSPTSGFTGQGCEAYTLMWSVTTSCGSSTDNVNIEFNYSPTTPNAGPDQLGIGGNTTTLAANIPVNGTGLWEVIVGGDGILSDPSSPNSSFTGVPTTDYKLTWSISTNCVSLSDTVHIQFLSCGLPITDDRDGKTYNTLLVNDQCWMAQNLNIGVRIPGTNDQTDNAIIEKYCYLNSEANCDVYGGLYQWNEMMQYSTNQGIKGICPTGWHLPSDAEWTNFSDYVKSQPNYLCSNNVNNIAKALASTTNWNTSSTTCAIGNNLLANNATGFTALPGGFRTTDSGGSFFDQGTYGHWWSSSANSTYYSHRRYLKNSSAVLNRETGYKTYGFSVRCIKDNMRTEAD